MKIRINKAYSDFRNNVTPMMFNKVQIGSMSIDLFEIWFDQRENTFNKIIDNMKTNKTKEVKCKHDFVSTPAIKVKVCMKCGQTKK